METTAARVLGPNDGKTGSLGTIAVRFMIDGQDAGERFALVEHPMAPRALAAPLHRALLGDEVVIGEPGDLISKPRGQWHTFWNAGDEPARILEIISPAGFESFFEDLVDLGGVTQIDPGRFAELCARYGLEADPTSIPGLIERFDLRLPGQPTR